MEEIDKTKGKWYILHTLSARENKVLEKLNLLIANGDKDTPIYEALIPMERISEIKSGKKREIKRKLFPGYVYVRMDLYKGFDEYGHPLLDEKAWFLVRGIQGVLSFVGSKDHPIPLSDAEVEDLRRQTMEVEDTKATAQIKVPAYIVIGGTVRIIDGAFANFEGLIEEIDTERGKLKLMVSIFGRSTPVELEFWQVGPDEE